MTNSIVSSGQSLSGQTLMQGDTLSVSSGGATIDTTISSGGAEYLLGGAASGTLVNAGGQVFVGSGTVIGATTSNRLVYSYTVATASNTTVMSGGSVTISSGSTGLNTQLLSGGQLTVSSGGTITDTTIGSGAIEVVSSGATANATDVQSGGTLVALPGAIVTSTLTETGGTSFSAGVVVYSGSHAVAAISGAVSGLVVSGYAATTLVLPGGTLNGGVLLANGLVAVSSGGVVSGLTVSGATEVISGGGVAIGTHLSGSGYAADEEVLTGGVAIGTTIGSGGRQDVANGTAINTVVSSGGYQAVSGGGTTSGTVISAGGREFVTSGTVIGTTVSSGGTLSAAVFPAMSVTPAGSGATVVSGASVLAGGIATFTYGATGSALSVASGGILIDSGGAVFAGGVQIENGAIIELGTSLNSASLGSSFTLDAATIQGLDQQLGTTAYDSLFQQVAGRTLTYNTANVPGQGSRNVFTATASDPDPDTCYLRGARILGERGEVAVEHLRVGDRVVAEIDGVRELQPIVWTGRARAVVRRDLPDDIAGWPVRIGRDAIAPGMPARDLLVTPEHCLFLDGRFIPARMLVNGRTISYDRSVSSFEYFHIETERHCVLIAEGLPSESYLDTGNRRHFRQDGALARLGGPPRSWQTDAAAPLANDRATVEPVFWRIAARAGMTTEIAAARLTSDPDLHLLTPAGKVVRPARVQDGVFSFLLPAEMPYVRLLSRADRPCDVIGPFVDDRRRLGVRIGAVGVRNGEGVRELDTHLHDATLPGWHACDGDDATRWSDGNALLPLAPDRRSGFVTLIVKVVAAGPYLPAGAMTAATTTVMTPAMTGGNETARHA